MSQYRNLLLIADRSMQKTPAFTRAVELARKTGARLHLCLVDHSPAIANLRMVDSSVMRMLTDEYMNEREAWLRKEALALAQEGLHVSHSAVWGKPADRVILGQVQKLAPDLVIKDVHPEPRLLRNLFTPLDWQLLRFCPTQLMLVHPAAGITPRRIIAAVDPAEDGGEPHELNDRILRAALAMAIQCDAELHVVYAFAYLSVPVDDVVGLSVLNYAKLHQDVRESHRQAFDRLLDRHSVPAERRHFLEHSNVEAAISDFASQDHADLVVMGTVYRNRFDRLMMGSTAERILDRLHCDVLALKPEGFQAAVQDTLGSPPEVLEVYPRDAA